jgi:DNA-binding transcriptional LysR family regulator
MARKLGEYRLQLVASADYLARHGEPQHPDDLARHACLLHKFPATGMIERWPLQVDEEPVDLALSKTITCTTMDPLTYLALDGVGIACLPDFSIRAPLKDGRLQVVLADYTVHSGDLWMLWPSSKQAAPKLRALIDYFKQHILQG